VGQQEKLLKTKEMSSIFFDTLPDQSVSFCFDFEAYGYLCLVYRTDFPNLTWLKKQIDRGFENNQLQGWPNVVK
jgi:hypothetical protein